jgi:CRISPR system Cascade subunit CasA
MPHNLLLDPLIGATFADGGSRPLPLPELLTELGEDRIIAFPDLRPHQSHAWHALLVQLAALALDHAGLDDLPPLRPEEWLTLLRGLTPDHPDDSPWSLLVEDWSKPAFLQPPAPSGSETAYGEAITEPDRIDLLVTAKNHEVKAARIGAATPGHWLFALTALQTMEGFLGAGNYGISRMNGGFSSRPCLGLAPSARPGAHFRRDVRVMLAQRAWWCETWHIFRPEGGKALLWLEPWDGVGQLSLEELDPWSVEICRRVRLRRHGDGLVAVKAGSKAARIAVSAPGGNLGDPWTPVENLGDGLKALSLSGAGFSYDRLSDMLFGTWKPAPLQQFWPGIDDDGSDLRLIARGLARGQGQTAGYHERILAVPPQAGDALRSGDQRKILGAIAKMWIDHVTEVTRKVLWPALLTLRDDSAWAGRWAAVLDAAVDKVFFDSLWDTLAFPEPNSMAAHEPWRRWLKAEAERVFEQAKGTAPKVSSRDYQIIARAEGLFGGLLNLHFADLKPRASA